jgi:hypothetical protein
MILGGIDHWWHHLLGVEKLLLIWRGTDITIITRDMRSGHEAKIQQRESFLIVDGIFKMP